MTKLQAVNSMLLAAGIPTVAALDTGGTSPAAEAERLLDDAQRKVENEIPAQTTQEEKEITADGSGYVAIPANTVDIKASGADAWRNLTPDFTNSRMYDRDNQTDVFTVGEVIEFTVTTRAAFTYLEPLAQEYIMARAAVMFNNRYGFPGRQPLLIEEERRARGRARAQDTHIRGINLLDTARAREVRGGRLPLPGTFSE